MEWNGKVKSYESRVSKATFPQTGIDHNSCLELAYKRDQILSFLFFFPFFCLLDVLSDPTTSYGGKEPHFMRRLVAQPLSEYLLADVFQAFPQL